MNITVGQVVYSRAGRDAGRKFIVAGVMDGLYAMIADGDLRRIEKPKKKKIKHLILTGEIIESINEKMTAGTKVTNSEIRKALALIMNDQDGVDNGVNVLE